MARDVPMTDVSVAVFAPSPLATVTIEAVADETTELHFHAGGQGVWVARMISVLGGAVTLCAALGGETGDVLRALIGREGIELREVEADTWNGAYIHDRRSGERREVVDVAAAAMSRHDLDAVYGATLVAAIEAGTCVLTGSMPSPVGPDIYQRLATDLRRNNVDVVADLSGEFLTAALEGGIGLVKISHEEAIRDGYASGPSTEELVAAVERLHAAGANDVVLSRDNAPVLALLDGELVEASYPTVEVADARGAGDTMTAAFSVSRARGNASTDGLRLAVAAATLNVTRHGLATGRREDIEQLANEITVAEIGTDRR
jgi:1-phosphofructokinase